MKSSKYIIYGLYDPRDGQLRYVGKSCTGASRIGAHRRLYKKENTHKANWLKQIDGKFSWIVLAECSSKEDLTKEEVRQIAYWRAQGCKLTNLTDGGDGSPGLVKPLAVKEKISRAEGGMTNEEIQQVLRLYSEGLSTRAIGKRLDRAHNVIWHILKRYGETRTFAETRYSQPPPPRWKLNPGDLEQIRSLRKQGMNPKEIAPRFGISWSRVYQLTCNL
jgi:transposase